MAAIFSQILNMSMTGSVVILLVMLARLILKRSPKIFSYALWSVVLFRLLCPVAFTAPVSVLDMVEPVTNETSNNTSTVSYIPATVNTQVDFIAVQPGDQPAQTETASESEEQLHMTPMHAAALFWTAGTVGMMLYSVVQFLRLRSKLIGAMHLNRNIYFADHIDTAFVVGLLQPRIYLPSSVPSNERYYILAHEQHHIRRGDHIIKLLAYLALCIHWFNPLVWLAFVLSGKDMEMSCDEAVIKRLGTDIRADYSASLLRLATHKKILSGMPLAFGEGDTKGRVLNMAKWKRPTKWVVAICLILCLCIVVVCVFNPEKEKTIEELTRQSSDSSVAVGIGDLHFTKPAGLTSEMREVENWSRAELRRILDGHLNRGQYDYFFMDNGVDFGGVVDFIVPEDRNIRLEELNLPSEWVGLDYIAGSSAYPYVEMEYTLLKDGKDYIQMYLYTYSGRGYFLWFYTEEGNPANKEAILNSVELGSFSTLATKLKRDEIVSLGRFNVTIPKGYGYHRNEAKILEITKKDLFNKQTLLGCVTAIPNPNLPMDTAEDRVKWVEAIGIDLSYEGKSYGYSINDEKEYGDIFVNREELLHGNTVMSENHYIYIAGDIVYDFCLNALEIDGEKEKLLLDSVWIKESATPSNNEVHQTSPIVNSNAIVTDTDLVQCGYLKMLLPSGFGAEQQNGVMVLTKDSVAVGGIMQWKYPEFQPSDIVELKKEELGVPIGYMSGNSAYGDMEYEIFWDGNPEGLNEQHTFFIDGDVIYDVWYDENQISDGIAEWFLKTVAINAEPVVVTEPGEQEAIAKCRAVLNAIQNGSYKIVSRQINSRALAPNGFVHTYSKSNEDWLSSTTVISKVGSIEDGLVGETYDVTSSSLCANGKQFSFIGGEWKENANNDSSRLPWLADFIWDESIISYQGLIEENGIECIMLRVDGQYIESDEYDLHYFVNFYFDEDDNFVNAKIQINLFRENEIEVTESIISLDPYIAAAEIDQEYFLATGKHLFVPAPSLNSRDTALERCKSELEHIQSCSQALVCKRDDGRDNGIIEYWKHENDWMTIQRHSGDNMIAYLCKDGSYYDNGEMHGDKIGARDDDGNVLWKAGTKPQSFHIPWLSRYQWNDKNVHYLGTEQANGEISIHLRINEPFPGFEWGNPDYSVTMVFDESHLFLRAELSVNQGHVSESGFTEVETVSSLWSKDVAERIDLEYQRAIR